MSESTGLGSITNTTAFNHVSKSQFYQKEDLNSPGITMDVDSNSSCDLNHKLEQHTINNDLIGIADVVVLEKA